MFLREVEVGLSTDHQQTFVFSPVTSYPVCEDSLLGGQGDASLKPNWLHKMLQFYLHLSFTSHLLVALSLSLSLSLSVTHRARTERRGRTEDRQTSGQRLKQVSILDRVGEETGGKKRKKEIECWSDE